MRNVASRPACSEAVSVRSRLEILRRRLLSLYSRDRTLEAEVESRFIPAACSSVSSFWKEFRS